MPGSARSDLLLLRSAQPFVFFSGTTWHLAIHLSFSQWRSGQNGAIQPSQLNTLLLTDRCLKCNRSHKAVVEVLTFRSQLHAETWHVVSMYNFHFHRTFLLVLPVDFVLPSSSLSVNTARIISWGSLSSLTWYCTVWFLGGFGRQRPELAQVCAYAHSHTNAGQFNNRKLSQANLLQSQNLKGI